MTRNQELMMIRKWIPKLAFVAGLTFFGAGEAGAVKKCIECFGTRRCGSSTSDGANRCQVHCDSNTGCWCEQNGECTVG
jgi:hypothetical protein